MFIANMCEQTFLVFDYLSLRGVLGAVVNGFFWMKTCPNVNGKYVVITSSAATIHILGTAARLNDFLPLPCNI